MKLYTETKHTYASTELPMVRLHPTWQAAINSWPEDWWHLRWAETGGHPYMGVRDFTELGSIKRIVRWGAEGQHFLIFQEHDL